MRWMDVFLSVSMSVLVYLNSLNGGLVFDDIRGISKNEDIRTDVTSVWRLWQDDFWGGAMSREQSHKSYRPLTVLSYRYLNYAIWGLEPFSYHLVNVLMHATVTGLLVLMTTILVGGADHIPMFAGSLFAVHSVHTEAVNNIVGRAELLSAVFFLLSFISYVRSCTASNEFCSSKTDWRWFTVSLLMAACSMLSKEQGVTCLAICTVYDILVHFDELSQWLSIKGLVPDRKRRNVVKHMPKPPFYVFYRLILTAVCVIVLLYFRLCMNSGTQPIFKPEELRASFHPDQQTRMLSFGYIHAFNAWLLLCPYSLCCDWSLGSIPLVHSLWDMKNLAPLTVYAVIAILFLNSLIKAEERFAVGMSLAFLVVPFMPSSGVVFRVGFVVAERVMYLPSIGFCMLVALGIKRLSSYFGSVTYFIFISLLILLSIKTFDRNKDWKTDFSLYQSGIKINPLNVKMYSNYGLELKNKGEQAKAKHIYEEALKIEPNYSEAMFNLGNVYSDEGKLEDALYYFRGALQSSYTRPQALNNMATMLLKLGKSEEAEQHFLELIQLKPDHAQAYNNLASLYGQTKQHDKAETMFKKAINVLPSYTEAHFNYGTLLYQMGRMSEAESYLRMALSLNPHHKGAQNNLQVVLYDKTKKS
ncbi:protein O-mannosyl-transferase TMTC1-like [Corticium candelabrum]|uniref:protein O-mannosyl-transferase TMTC1-like n=1 Tax=Corticium candelabrum TaxID=121492 RepID=UPI002E3024C9|nr:protein O-mannosyl-transferase TMTC1-like [Corticium candelabrum]